MTDESNARLRERIEAARARGAELAGKAGADARDFVAEHPVAAVAGGIAIGVLITAALTRRARPDTGSAVRQVAANLPNSARLARLAAIATEFAINFAKRAAEESRVGLEKAEEAGTSASQNAAEVRKRLTALAEVALHRIEALSGRLHR